MDSDNNRRIELITQVVGDCGSGKTLLCAIKGYEAYKKGKPVYANIKLSYPFTILEEKFFRDYHKTQITNAFVLFDEFSIYYNARNSFSKQNRRLRPFIIQTRKKSLELWVVTQQSKMLDVNIRNNSDYYIYPKLKVSRDGHPFINKSPEWDHKDGDRYVLIYEKYDKYYNLLKKGVYLDVQKWFNIYDTTQVIEFREDEK